MRNFQRKDSDEDAETKHEVLTDREKWTGCPAFSQFSWWVLLLELRTYFSQMSDFNDEMRGLRDWNLSGFSLFKNVEVTCHLIFV